MEREEILKEYYDFKAKRNIEKFEAQAIEAYTIKSKHNSVPNFIKLLKSNDIQTFSYTPDLHYTEAIANRNIPNCIPCKHMLVVFDEPIIDSFADFNLFTTKMFISEESPSLYTVVQTSALFFEEAGKTRHQITTLGNILKLQDSYLRTSYAENAQKTWHCNSQEDFGEMLTSTLMSHFIDFNRVLYKAKAEQYLQVDAQLKQKVTFKNYKGQKTSKQIISPSIIYIGSKKDYVKTSYAKQGLPYRKCDHATQVLGHWRRLSERQQIGHDREGNEIQDFTWIKSYIRGEGDLVCKHHVIRGNDDETALCLHD